MNFDSGPYRVKEDYNWAVWLYQQLIALGFYHCFRVFVCKSVWYRHQKLVCLLIFLDAWKYVLHVIHCFYDAFLTLVNTYDV